MDQLPDNEIIRDILENKSEVINKLYNESFPMIERMVLNSGGDIHQAKDIFQEGWTIVYTKISLGELSLSCKFTTYLYAVCKRTWLQEKRKKNYRMLPLRSDPEIAEDFEPFMDEGKERIKQLYYKHFNNLSKDCQKVLRMHLNNVPIEEIRKLLKYQTAHYAMDRKYRCKKSLIIRILNDPNFKSVQNEYSEQIRSIF